MKIDNRFFRLELGFGDYLVLALAVFALVGLFTSTDGLPEDLLTPAPVEVIERVGDDTDTSVVTVVRVDGPILDSCIGSCPSVAVYADEFSVLLEKIGKTEAVRAVVIELATPGGSASGAAAMSDSVSRLAEKKPVYVYVKSLAASGGMYVLAGLEKAKYPDRVFAAAGSMLANVGVITGDIVRYEGVTKIQTGYFGPTVEAEHITAVTPHAGYGKNGFSPFADPDESAFTLAKLEESLAATRDTFVDKVATARGVSLTLFNKDGIGASIVAAEVARELELIDDIITFPELQQKIADGLGVNLDKLQFVWTVNTVTKPGLLDKLGLDKLIPGMNLSAEENAVIVRNRLLHTPVLALSPQYLQ